jgi:hypothetical protein
VNGTAALLPGVGGATYPSDHAYPGPQTFPDTAVAPVNFLAAATLAPVTPAVATLAAVTPATATVSESYALAVLQLT